MTFIWLIVWLVQHTPAVQMFGTWNAWGTALAVCVVLDLLTSIGANARAAGRRASRT